MEISLDIVGTCQSGIQMETGRCRSIDTCHQSFHKVQRYACKESPAEVLEYRVDAYINPDNKDRIP